MNDTANMPASDLERFTVKIIKEKGQTDVFYYDLFELANFVIYTSHLTSRKFIASKHARTGLIKIEFDYFTVYGRSDIVVDELYFSLHNSDFIDHAVLECKK